MYNFYVFCYFCLMFIFIGFLLNLFEIKFIAVNIRWVFILLLIIVDTIYVLNLCFFVFKEDNLSM